MKPFATVLGLLGLLVSGSAILAETVHKQMEVREGGHTFKLSRFNDESDTPFRLYFWDEDLTGSSFRFSADGHIDNFRAGDELYRVNVGDYTVSMSNIEGPRSSNSPKEFTTFDCADCSAAVEVCYGGLPKFCRKVDRGFLGEDGAKAVKIMCRNRRSMCSSFGDICGDVCASEEETGSTSKCASNGLDGVQSSNGKACCHARCSGCGGVGCSQFGLEFDLTADDCCATEIEDDGQDCSVTQKAPCRIDVGTPKQ